MFLERINELKLVEHNPSTNIISLFPLQVRKAVVNEIVNSILVLSDLSLLSSAAHVDWVLECLGAAFSLPMTEFSVIQGAIEIYFRWLKGPARPVPMSENIQHYFRVIFQHFSLLFAVRSVQNSQQVQQHNVLCSRVLKILEMVGRELSDSLETESWELLLKVMLGITDALLSPPVGSGEEAALSTELCPQLLQVLCELWLRSQTRNEALWTSLQSLFMNWCHRLPTIVQWNATNLGISQNVIRQLYGPTEGTDGIAIVVPGSTSPPVLIHTDKEFLFFSWYRFIHMVDNPLDIAVPTHYQQAMKGILQIIDAFLSVGSTLPPSSFTHRHIVRPSVNSILHLFGEWLFSATEDSREDFRRGKSVAYMALCRLFCASGNSIPILSTYLTRFYRALLNGLNGNVGRIITSILLNSTNIFSTGLPGVEILVSSYISAINRILPLANPSISFPQLVPEVRKACIEITGSLICLSNYLNDLEMCKANALHIPNFRKLQPFINDILLHGLQHETDPGNTQSLLWNICVFLFEQKDDFPRIFPLVLDAMKPLILSTDAKHPTSVTLVGFQVLSEIAEVQKKLKVKESECVVKFIARLCQFIQEKLFAAQRSGNMESPTLDAVVSAAFYCLRDWLANGSVLFHPKSAATMEAVFVTLEVGLTGANPASPVTQTAGKKKPSVTETVPPSAKIFDAAYTTLLAFLREINRFPVPTGASRHSTLQNELDLCITMKIKKTEGKYYFRHFSWDSQTIFTIVERPNTKDGSGITVMVRDITGRYSWDFKMLWYPDSTRAKTISTQVENHKKLLAQHDKLETARATQILSHGSNHLKASGNSTSSSTIDDFDDDGFDDDDDFGDDDDGFSDDDLAAAAENMSDDDFDDNTTYSTASMSQTHYGVLITSPPSPPKLSSKQDVYSTLVLFGLVSGSIDPRGTEILGLQNIHPIPVSKIEIAASQQEPDIKIANSHLKLAIDAQLNPDDPYSAAHYETVYSNKHLPTPTWHSLVKKHKFNTHKALKAWTSTVLDPILKRSESQTLTHCKLPYYPGSGPFWSLPQFWVPDLLWGPGSILSDYLNQIYTTPRKSLYNILMNSHDSVLSFVRDSSILTHRIRSLPPTPDDPYSTPCKFQLGRQFLSHFSYLSLDNQDRFHSLRHSDKLMQALRGLDKQNERERHNIGVFYIRDTQLSLRDVLHNSGGSFNYQLFLNQLAYFVTLPAHKGWNGGLDRSPRCIDGVVAPYYSAPFWEVVFHCSTHLPNSTTDQTQKRKLRHVSKDPVAIIWVDSNDFNYNPKVFGSTHSVQIVILPLKNGLYRVKLYSENSKFLPLLGPLRDEMIVSQHILGLLVRKTALLADRLDKWSNQSYVRPQIARRKHIISQIASPHRLNLTRAQFYAQFFSFKR